MIAVVSLILLGLLFSVAALSGIWAFSSSQLAATANANAHRVAPATGAVSLALAAQHSSIGITPESTESVTAGATGEAVAETSGDSQPDAVVEVESRTAEVQPLMTQLSRPSNDDPEVTIAPVAHPGEQTFDQRTLPGRLNHALTKVIAAAKGGRDNQDAVRVDPKLNAEIEQLRAQLVDQAKQLALLRGSANSTMNDLGVRVGSLQAHITRLNALGHRLTQGANLDDGEFNFNDEPAVGGSASITQVQDRNDPTVGGTAPTAAMTDMGSSTPGLLQTQLQQLEHQMRQSDSQLAVLEVLLRGRRLERQSQPVGWPAAAGWVSSNFGERQDPFTGVRSFHKGIDIAAGIGTGVQAAASGLVVYAGPQGDLGHVVEISHGSGYTTRYAHNSEILVKKGDFVVRGENIAAMGSSGRSTGSHLHFEVIENGKAVDPEKYLESQ